MNQIILETKQISKSFGKVQALNNVDFFLYKGKIHGLLGENGAGKTSLMNVLSGIYQPEKGSIYINGEKQERLTPDSSLNLGIGMVHQEFRLIESFSIKDNLTLSKSNIYKEDFDKAYDRYSQIFSLTADAHTPISELSVGEKQKIEIIKLIFNNTDIMLLDEPTAVLTPQETDQLKLSLDKLSQEEEKTIVFITHKLKEIKQFTENIFVMKNGKMVAKELETKSTDDKELVSLMMGKVGFEKVNKNNPKGEIKLKIENLLHKNTENDLNTLEDITLHVKSGEILGIAGVSGNGQVELANIISGIEQNFKGKILINDIDISKKGVKARKELNLSYIPENRLGVGLAPGVSILDNSAIKEYRSASYGPHLLKNKLLENLELLIKEFSIKAPDPNSEVSTLSGGNMQKLLMGRELISNPEIIIASQPTRGLDVRAVESIHNLIIHQRDSGTAIMLFSEDLDELFKLSNRIIVLYEGKVIKEFNISKANRHNVGLAMAGINE
jgi:simple sugar transport system ATP-binding protein